MSDKLLYRVSEAAEVLGLGRSKTYALMQSGALHSVKIDGARRIRRADLMAYVDSLPKAA